MIAGVKWIAATLALFGAVGACMPGPAGGVFPGRNGKILVTTEREASSEEEYGATWLASLRERPEHLRLPGAPFFPFLPVVAPNGNRVAYQTGRGVAVSRMDGRPRTQQLTRGYDVKPAWSPNGGALAFLRDAYPTGDGLYIVRTRGGGRRRVFARPALEFAWSPEGRRLAVIPGDRTLIDDLPLDAAPIFVADLQGSAREVARGVQVSWSRTGWLAYRRGEGLYVARPDGSRERIIATGLGQPNLFGSAPYTWSADGRRIAFARAGRIFVAEIPGAQPQPLASGFAPLTFSPDGRLLAFSRYPRRLVVKPVNGGHPSVIPIQWSSDGEDPEAISALDWQVRHARSGREP